MQGESQCGDVYLKTYRQGVAVLLAACDCDLMGKRFEEGKLHLEVCSDFFGTEMASCQDLEKALSRATIANFVGKTAVDKAIELGYINKENVLVIDGVPCAQMVMM
jgi:hypothetical protein